MTAVSPYRPWGELSWSLSLSDSKQWEFIGCLSTEERSVEALIELHSSNLLASEHFVRIHDTKPEDSEREDIEIEKRLGRLQDVGLEIQPRTLNLDDRVNGTSWPEAFDFSKNTSVCLDISCMPKRFFFPILRAAFKSATVENLIVLYAKPAGYPDRSISRDPDPWSTLDQFSCIDDEVEREAEKHLIINTGFAVDGLVEYIKEPKDEVKLDILVPFPAEPWKSVHRSWKSAHAIEAQFNHDPKRSAPNYHRIPALDASTAFDRLLGLTNFGSQPVGLAPLGPKPISMAMCLLASQSDLFPVYYAQPKTYALNYSEGYEKTYAYWIKHNGASLYEIPPRP